MRHWCFSLDLKVQLPIDFELPFSNFQKGDNTSMDVTLV